ncbi:MAG: hypothetical protein ACRD0A_14595 [Acidimicrobiales bacterium]
MTTIDEALDAFLAEQAERLAERTYRNYLEVIELFCDCMNGYGYESLSAIERRRWQQAFDDGEERAFTRLFGPEKIPEQVGQFLGWFVIRKVMAGQEFLKACGTVTKRLGKWLAASGYVDADEAADMAERGAEAGDELPKADKLAELLYEQARTLPPFDPDSIPDDEWIEDQLWIERVEPGALWFDGGAAAVRAPVNRRRRHHRRVGDRANLLEERPTVRQVLNNKVM